jgi:hypothetical protein
MNKFLSVGDIRIHRIVELEGPFLPALDVFPTLSAECSTQIALARAESP